MKHNYQKKSAENIMIAKEHIKKIFDFAGSIADKDIVLATRQVANARRIAMKFKLRLPSKYKRLFCPHCYRFMLPGKNLRVRVHEHRVIYYCRDCKRFWRKPLDRKVVKKASNTVNKQNIV